MTRIKYLSSLAWAMVLIGLGIAWTVWWMMSPDFHQVPIAGFGLIFIGIGIWWINRTKA